MNWKFKVTLDGRERILCLDESAQKAFELEFGYSIWKPKDDYAYFRLSHMARIVWVGLLREDRSFTLEDALQIIPVNLRKYLALLREICEGMFEIRRGLKGNIRHRFNFN